MLTIRPLADADAEARDALPLSRLVSPGGEYLVAWLDGAPVGHAHVDWAAEPPELQDVWVREEVRRTGVATALTREAEQRAARRGHERLSLEVSEANTAARSLYERLGYSRTADFPRRVQGTIELRTGPLEVDDVLLRFERPLARAGPPR